MENYFATNLKHLRLQNGMTQAELAKKIGKDYSTIGKWELGQRSPIMADMVKISELFNIPLETLISKNISLLKTNNQKDQLDVLFSKHKDVLTESDKTIIRTVIEERKKEIDKQIDGENHDN